MVSIYSDAEYLSAYKQKQRIWWTFIGVTVLYLTICVGLVCYHASLPYADPRLTSPKSIVYVLTALYIAFVYPYMGIKYGRVKRYFALLNQFSYGIKQEENNYFYCFDRCVLEKNSISAESCVFETWSKKKCEWNEREAYFDVECDRPPFENGDYVRYITQSNFVIEYEILQKKALEFEEVKDEEAIEE